MNRLLKQEEYNLIQSIFKATQEGLSTSMHKLLTEHYGKDNVIYNKKYIVAIGEIPVGVVAHMDTVHRTPVKELFYDKDKNVMWSPEGIGADDRAGIYGMIEILRQGYKPTLILTTDEEIGGIGASALAADKHILPTMKFLVELDRRGVDDCVFYECDNPSFEEKIESYGFKTNFGSFSDISILCPALGIAGVNLSIGYEDEHTRYERLYVDNMFNTVEKVCDILQDGKEGLLETYRYIKKEYSGYNYGAYGYSYDFYGSPDEDEYGYDFDFCGKDSSLCWNCLSRFDNNLLIITEEGHKYCGDCYGANYTSCSECGSEIHDPSKIRILCDKCGGDQEKRRIYEY